MAARKIDKDQKRRDIARAAMCVFSEHGFDAAPMKLVAGAAGVGKGTIYEYFPSKDDLIATSIQFWLEEMIAKLENPLAGIHDPESRLRFYVQFFVDMFLVDMKITRITVSIFQLFMTKLHDTAYADTLKTMFRSGVESIEKILLDGMESGSFRITDRKEAELIAINLTAYLDGICLDYMTTGGQFDLKEQVDHYMKYMLEESLK